MSNSSLSVHRLVAAEHATTRPGLASRFRRFASGPHAGIWVATIVLFGLSAVAAPVALTGAAVASMLPFWAVLTVVSVGQTIVVQQRGIDMSVPGTVTLCAMVLPSMMSRHELPLVLGIVIVLLAGAVIGLVNGLVITWLQITPLIATLAVNALGLGAMFAYTQSVGSAAPTGLQEFANAQPLGIPMLALVALAIVLVTSVVLTRTTLGRRFVAVGANPAAAAALGIRQQPYVIGAYVSSSVFAAAAAVLLVGYIQNPNANIGENYLFQSITAVVIGGTSLAGGRGSLLATAVAALFLSQLAQVVLTMGAAPSTQLLVQAAALVLALTGASLFRSLSNRGAHTHTAKVEER